MEYNNNLNKKESVKYDYSKIIFDEYNNNLRFEERVQNANEWLQELECHGISLNRKVIETGSKEVVEIFDDKTSELKKYINLGSNDYLNLSHHPEIIKAVAVSAAVFGCGAGSAPHILGTSRLHDTLEKRIAAFKGCEAAIVQSCGFSANCGLINALLKKKDIAIFDQFSHQSLIEGANRWETNRIFFRHNDMESLEYILKKAEKEFLNRLVVVDGIYSMEGDMAPLNTIAELTKKYHAWLLVDDAHATGTTGNTGKGTIEYFNLEGKVDIVTGTFSKAVGSVGGFIAGKKEFINYIMLSNNSFIFSTAAFIPSIAASLKGLEIIESEPWLLTNLKENTRLLKNGLIELGYHLTETVSPIIPVLIGDEDETHFLGAKLREYGIIAPAVTFPAVPKGKGRIRLSVTAGLTSSQSGYVLDIFKKLKKN